MAASQRFIPAQMASGLRLGFGQFASERSDRAAAATSECALVVDDPVAPSPATRSAGRAFPAELTPLFRSRGS